jgi:hypothetical protein
MLDFARLNRNQSDNALEVSFIQDEKTIARYFSANKGIFG